LSSKVEVIHCGVDTQFFSPATEQPYSKAPASDFTVLCIGTLHEVKGQTYLLQACRLLEDSGIAVRCQFIGEGEDRRSLESEARQLHLEDRVKFCGNLNRGEVRRRLQQADVVCAPSVPTKSGRREGIPVVLMEAMASGVPVVASRLSGIPELVEHERTGLLFEPGNPHELAAALRRLHDDRNLHAHLAAAARQKIEREFNLHRNAALLQARFQRTAV
jgi:glycosyltransferase involved in cell wall biosynthesis